MVCGDSEREGKIAATNVTVKTLTDLLGYG